MSEKASDAFRTISEVADHLDIPPHVLRFWETKFHQIKPLKRTGGRRFYRPQDLALIARIKTLLYDEGMTIKGVQKVLKDNGVAAVIEGEGVSPGMSAGSPQLVRRLSDVARDLSAAKSRLDEALAKRH